MENAGSALCHYLDSFQRLLTRSRHGFVTGWIHIQSFLGARLEPATYSHEQMWDLRIWPRHTCGGVEGLDLGPLGGDSKLVGGIVESPHSHEAAPQGITHQVTPGGGHVWRGSPGVGVGIVHLDRGQRVVVVGSVAACSSSPALGFEI